MYGLIIEGIAEAIRSEYGEEAWGQVKKKAALNADSFTTHQMYNDKLIPQLQQACQEVLKQKPEKFMKVFGDYFVNFIGSYGYDTMLRTLGRHLRDFINGLDNLHEYLKFSYPRLKAPSFRIEKEDETGLTLHYRSKRKGFFHYVVGQIIKVGEVFYSTKVGVEVVHAEERQNTHVVLRLKFDNSAFFKAQKDPQRSQKLKNLQIGSEFFLECFPFHIIFDRNMTIRHAGNSLLSVMPQAVGGKMEATFTLQRPIMDFNFKNVLTFQNITFELTTIKEIGKNAAAAGGKGLGGKGGGMKGGMRGGGMSKGGGRGGDDEEMTGRMKLKGQMKFIKTWDAVIFLASPVMENLDKMIDLSVYITDLSMHDVSRDLILVGAQQSRELAELLNKEQKKGVKLEEAMKKLDKLRQRGDELLYSMIPATVAARMRAGESLNDLCQTHEAATILFSDVPGFIEATTRLQPMQIMSLLNAIFSKIDGLIERHKVYKVETVGDVYMVAAGAPEANPEHATMMSNLALDMVEYIPDIKDPDDENKSAQIRIGMHSGPVVTGLVGLKMPRFCFFGDAVNTSARMSTNGESMKIHISEYTKACLAGKPYLVSHRGTIKVKGKGEMNTYWLVKRTMDGTCVSPAKVKLPTLNIPSNQAELEARRKSSALPPIANPPDAPAAGAAAPASDGKLPPINNPPKPPDAETPSDVKPPAKLDPIG